MEGGKIDLLSVDEFVASDGSKVFNVVGKKDVGGFVTGEQDDLSTPSRKLFDDCCSYAGGAALNHQSLCRKLSCAPYCDHHNFAVHQSLRATSCSPKIKLEQI